MADDAIRTRVGAAVLNERCIRMANKDCVRLRLERCSFVPPLPRFIKTPCYLLARSSVAWSEQSDKRHLFLHSPMQNTDTRMSQQDFPQRLLQRKELDMIHVKMRMDCGLERRVRVRLARFFR